MKLFLFCILVLTSPLALADLYRCETSFGETVPIRQMILRAGLNCASCRDLNYSIPMELIDPELSKRWNPQYLQGQEGQGHLKRLEVFAEGREVFLETRYMSQQGPGFFLEMSCEDSGLCKGNLKNSAKEKVHELLLEPSLGLFDQSFSARKAARVRLMTTQRGQFGLLARIFRYSHPQAGHGKSLPLSASGELKVTSLQESFVLDAGVDQFFFDHENARLAALEIKIQCHRIERN